MQRRWLIAAAAIVVIVLIILGLGRLRSGTGGRGSAVATLVASPIVPAVRGHVTFKDVPGGTLVTAEVGGLPLYSPGPPPQSPHGFHIHEGSTCEVGDPANPFQAAGGHWNPDDQPHGNHAGDFPVLFSQPSGLTEMTFFTDRFSVADIVDRTVIIHLNPDDYRSQPAGDSGLRIACGVITR